jgi:hypothetical protein
MAKEVGMSPREIFNIDMALGYLAWALCAATYVWPRLRAMDRVEAHRAIATFNSFRFFGLAFLLPGFVGPNLPPGFATQVAYGDLATALLARCATRIDLWRLGSALCRTRVG